MLTSPVKVEKEVSSSAYAVGPWYHQVPQPLLQSISDSIFIESVDVEPGGYRGSFYIKDLSICRSWYPGVGGARGGVRGPIPCRCLETTVPPHQPPLNSACFSLPLASWITTFRMMGQRSGSLWTSSSIISQVGKKKGSELAVREFKVIEIPGT